MRRTVALVAGTLTVLACMRDATRRRDAHERARRTGGVWHLLHAAERRRLLAGRYPRARPHAGVPQRSPLLLGELHDRVGQQQREPELRGRALDSTRRARSPARRRAGADDRFLRADVDTRNSTECADPNYPPSGGGYPAGATCMNPTSNGVWWSLTPGQMVITWDQVGFFSCHTDARDVVPDDPLGDGVRRDDRAGRRRERRRFRHRSFVTASAAGRSATPAAGPAGSGPATTGARALRRRRASTRRRRRTRTTRPLPKSRQNGIASELCTQSNLTPPQAGRVAVPRPRRPDPLPHRRAALLDRDAGRLLREVSSPAA